MLLILTFSPFNVKLKLPIPPILLGLAQMHDFGTLIDCSGTHAKGRFWHYYQTYPTLISCLYRRSGSSLPNKTAKSPGAAGGGMRAVRRTLRRFKNAVRDESNPSLTV